MSGCLNAGGGTSIPESELGGNARAGKVESLKGREERSLQLQMRGGRVQPFYVGMSG